MSLTVKNPSPMLRSSSATTGTRSRGSWKSTGSSSSPTRRPLRRRGASPLVNNVRNVSARRSVLVERRSLGIGGWLGAGS
jgi:hypothetical protein